jgi:hypothetical protein
MQCRLSCWRARWTPAPLTQRNGAYGALQAFGDDVLNEESSYLGIMQSRMYLQDTLFGFLSFWHENA